VRREAAGTNRGVQALAAKNEKGEPRGLPCKSLSRPDQLAAKGCLAVTRSWTTRWALGSPFIARAMASFVA